MMDTDLSLGGQECKILAGILRTLLLWQLNEALQTGSNRFLLELDDFCACDYCDMSLSVLSVYVHVTGTVVVFL